jgi:hypothetical protein
MHLGCQGWQYHSVQILFTAPQVIPQAPSAQRLTIFLDLCRFPECQNQRSQWNEQYILFCNDHRCEHDNCRNPKDVGVFCRSHTCDHQYCLAFAPGIGMEDPQRFCERHRQCQRPQCPRLCHTRDDGQPSPFCGAHYCQEPDCEDGRDGGLFCPVHTCAEPGCLKGRETPKSEYCKKHRCKTKHCRLRRLESEYCPYHECVYDGCGAEVVEGRVCEGHRRRMGANFGKRLSSQGVGYTLYEMRIVSSQNSFQASLDCWFDANRW